MGQPAVVNVSWTTFEIAGRPPAAATSPGWGVMTLRATDDERLCELFVAILLFAVWWCAAVPLSPAIAWPAATAVTVRARPANVSVRLNRMNNLLELVEGERV